MYSIKVIQKSENRTFEQVFQCEHYKRDLISGDKFSHRLTMYGVEHFNDPVDIDLYNLPEDKYGKYDQSVFVMNEKGKTIDRY